MLNLKRRLGGTHRSANWDRKYTCNLKPKHVKLAPVEIICWGHFQHREVKAHRPNREDAIYKMRMDGGRPSGAIFYAGRLIFVPLFPVSISRVAFPIT